MRWLAFLPHVVIGGLYGILVVPLVPQMTVLIALAVVHLLLPIWAVTVDGRRRKLRWAFARGPGWLLATYAGLLGWSFLDLRGGSPDDSWLAWPAFLVAAATVVGWGIWCSSVFAVASRVRARRARPS